LVVRFSERPGAALGILTGLNLLNYLDRYVVAGTLPLIISGLHLTDDQAGSLQSVFILVYAVASPAMGWLGDRGRRLPLAAVAVALWCVATFASGLAPTFLALLLARALVGVGEAGYSVVTPSLLSDLYPAERRGRVLAIFYAAIPVGSALGYIFGGSVGSALGWRSAFMIAGGPGLLFALGLLLLREPRRGRYDTAAKASAPLALRETLAALRARPSYLVNTAAQAIYTFSIGGLGAWMPTYFVRERHLPLSEASTVFGGILVVAGLVGTIVGGWVGDRLARRYASAYFTSSAVALFASMPFTLLAILSPHPSVFWPAMFFTLLLLFVNTGPLNAAMANVLPPDLRARGFALYTLAIHALGDGPSPKLIGLASDRFGLKLPVLVAGLLLVPAGLVLLAGRNTLVRDLEASRA
jgi:predicted MFS family arabinose efflux permease